MSLGQGHFTNIANPENMYYTSLSPEDNLSDKQVRQSDGYAMALSYRTMPSGSTQTQKK